VSWDQAFVCFGADPGLAIMEMKSKPSNSSDREAQTVVNVLGRTPGSRMRKHSNEFRAERRLRPIAIGVFLLSIVAIAIYYIISPPTARGLSSSIVISQVYGGGGNSGSILRNDFIELFNRGSSPVSLSGWSVQYASTTGTTWQKTDLTAVTLQPGQYYLVQEAQGTGGTTNLPTPDAIGVIPMSATAGKVALVSNQTQIAGGTSCPSGVSIIDFVGFGTTTNCFEGAGPTASLSNTTAALRATNGCTETDNNSTDFVTGAPNPRNTTSSLNPCSGPLLISINDVSVPEGNSGTTTATFTISLSAPAPVGGVTFDVTTQDDSATTADNDYAGRSLVNQTIPLGSQTYMFDVSVNGDTGFEPNETFFVNVTNVTGATISDGQAVGTINNDDCPPSPGDIVISQVYGGGGNSGATLTHDFIELFNQGPVAINLSGWSVQYISSTGTGTWAVTPLSGSIAPGGYYLVQEAQGTGGTIPLPTPDAVGTIPMAAGAGKVALSSSTTAFSGNCPNCVVDLVGYGGASCFEGAGPTAATSNTTAALRKRGGCFDSDNNNIDFSIGSPLPRNTASPTKDCGFIALAIHDIQGAGLVTPFLGQDVSTTGIVTGLKTNGFFMQTADVDANPATSEGIFVFTSSAPAVGVGNAVTAQGTATEFFNLTQIESTLPGDVIVNSTGNPLPAAVTLTTVILDPAGTPSQLERFEGMRMHADSLISVAPTNEFGETFTVLPGVARPLREPGIEISLQIPNDPTSGMPDCCIPRWDENPERIMIDSDGIAGAAVISTTSNVTFSNVTGPLDFTFSDYKVLPEAPPTTSANMSAVPVPVPSGGEFTVAGFNIENFNNNATQRQKAALAIRDVLRLPDIIGTIEIFELSGLQALAAEIESISGVHYEARLVEADGISGDADQDVGFLIKTSRIRIDSVTQVELMGCDGTAANCNTFIDPNTNQPALLNDRPPLILRATVDPSGVDPRSIIVVVNHLRSFIDVEALTGEGPRVRAKRKAQGEFLANVLQDLQVNNPSTPVMSIGDYNAFQFNDGFTDPVATIKGAPTADDEVVVDASPDLVNPNFINLTDGLPPDQRYSFIFDGTPQALDHFILNTVANSILQRYTIARNNSDFPEVPGSLFSAVATRPERCSDHDMPVAYFKFPCVIACPANVTQSNDPGQCGALVNYSAPGASASCSTVTCTPPTGSFFPVGSTTVTCSDSTGGSCSFTVTVNDTEPPTVTGVSANPAVLWPPNHRLVPVTINYTTLDNCGPVTCTLSVASNEPINSTDDGDTAPDWIIEDAHHVMLRAERSGIGTGRTYTITITCTDGAGNPSVKTVVVTVPLTK
jgi:uncharacterized protein